MLAPVDAAAGVRLDLRNAAVVVATLFGGVLSGGVCLVVILACRLALGGAGIAAGVASLLITFAISAGDVALRKRTGTPLDHRHLAGVGVAVAVGGLAVIGLFPGPEVAEFVLRDVAAIWVVLMPLTILALGSVILNFDRSRRLTQELAQREGELSAILDNSPIAIFLKDRQGRYRLINRTYTDWFGDRQEDLYGRTTAEVYSAASPRLGAITDREVLEYGGVSHLQRATETAKPGLLYVETTKFPIRDPAAGSSAWPASSPTSRNAGGSTSSSRARGGAACDRRQRALRHLP